MYNRAVETIKKHNMLVQGDRVVAGLSGGADSCALLHMLSALSKEMELYLYAVHINHGIRGEEAKRDEDFVKKFCSELGIELFVYHCDIPSEAEKRGLGEEETGRIIRYEKFREVFEKVGADKIAVAHNLNDRAETLIMNLCRGAGLKGLASIQETNGDIIRPLIDCDRKSIEKYCEDNSIAYCTDSTNLENGYTRNKIRNILLPWLNENINPAADINIAMASKLIREEEDYLESLALECYNRIAVNKNGAVLIDAESLLKENAVIRRRVIRTGLRNINSGLKDFSRKHVEDAENILMGRTGRKISLPGGVTVRKNYDKLEIFTAEKKEESFVYDIEIGKELFIPETGKYILLSFDKEKKPLTNLCTKKVDYGKIKGKIQMRTRQSGDTIGIRNGRKKLKDYFIDEKIPADERGKIPLLACGNSIVLAGERLGQDY